MAITTNIAELIIRLRDEVTSTSKRMEGSFHNLTKSLSGFAAVAGVAIGTGAFTRFLLSSVQAANEAEDAIARLKASQIAAGQESEAYSRHLLRLADSLQRTTAFTDEEIIAAQSLLISFGASSDQIEKLLKITLDFAAGLRIDLNTATLLVSKAIAGSTSALSRYGVTIDENLPKQERITQALDQLGQRFSGQAQAQVETMGGRLRNLAKSYDDLKEAIGGAIARQSIFMNAIQGLTDFLNQPIDRRISVLTAKIFDLESQLSRLANIRMRDILLTESIEDFAKLLEKQPPAVKVLASQMLGLREQLRALKQEAKAGEAVPKLPPPRIAPSISDEERRKQIKSIGEVRDEIDDAIQVSEKSLEQIELDIAGALARTREEGVRATESLRTAQEKYNDELERLGKLLDAGAISSETFFRGAKKAQEDLKKTTEETSDVARQLGLTFTSAFEDAVLAGKQFQDILDGILKDIARIILRKTVTEPLAGLATKGIDILLGGLKGIFGFQTGPGEFKQVPGPPSRALPAVVHGGEVIGRPMMPTITINNFSSSRAQVRRLSDREILIQIGQAENRAVERSVHEVRERKLRGGNFSNAFD